MRRAKSHGNLPAGPARHLRRQKSPLNVAGNLEFALERLRIEALPILQPFLGERRLHARAQECRIERFWKVIVGPELEAADHAFHVVDRGDHHHRDVAEILIGFHLLEHFVPVHFRHHDVQQHEIERAGAHNLECLTTVLRRFHLEPAPHEPP